MSDERPTPAAAARMPADLTGRDSGSHAGRAHRRPRPGRRRDGAAAPACRGTPPPRGPRPTAPAPSAPFPCARSGRRRRPARRRSRSGAAAAGAGADRRCRARRRPGLLGRLTRRVALWGAGPGGAYLAWHPSAPAARVAVPRRRGSRRSAGRAPRHARPPGRAAAPGRPLGRRCARRVPGLVRRAAAPPGGPDLPARSSTVPSCCASCPAPPQSSPWRLPPPRRSFPARRLPPPGR